ncbi:MBL fold metallo-hydrolase [Estrella lausannensis]|uniref:Metallo-beta-lactamase domain-containing protein n=1 Tax=Estrella lausannensis TaxID=483423 RepID=A0A0H5E7W3_9BACT|nr:MBL fold metallo-hydrolase [Estrella lausannensis]CRX39425.1 Conserved hypothetical protein [Estrella lausannensis]
MKKKRFSNPHIRDEKRTFFKFLQWRFGKKENFSSERRKRLSAALGKVPFEPVDLTLIKNPGPTPQVTWIGHSTLLIQYRGYNILTDPVLNTRCSPIPFIGPKRLSPPAISLLDLPPIDLVVISHNHYDHLERKTVSYLGNAPLWLVPLGLKKWFKRRGVHHIEEMDWWDSKELDAVSVTCTPSQHWSKRTPFDTNQSLWASWVVRIGDFKFYFAGDTGYNPYQFKEIGEKFGPFDLAAIPIGAYEPRWFMKNYHVNPEEAVKIHQDIASRLSIAIHHRTFLLADEPWDAPAISLKEAIEASRMEEKEFLSIPVGRTVKVPLQND